VIVAAERSSRSCHSMTNEGAALSYPPPGPGPQTPRRPAPLDQPQYNATIQQAVSRFWRKYAVFSGRASRSEYWWWTLVSFIVSVVLQLLGSLIFGGGLFSPPDGDLDLSRLALPLLPSLVWALVVLVPSIALAVRRLHDTNRSGWWYLLILPTMIGLPFQLVGLASIDPVQLAAGNFSDLAIGPLVVGWALSLLGLVGSIVLLIFFVIGPDPRGVRFDAAVPGRGSAGL
jgi:uncharacterized membrane protein YhaH (DUF805 family)